MVGCVTPASAAMSTCVMPEARNSRMRVLKSIGRTIDVPMTDGNRGAYESFLSTWQDRKMENMGKRIEALRLSRGWSQTFAAKQLNISQPSLSDIEKGVTKSLKGETVVMLCRVFHTTAEYIYFGGKADDPELPLVEAELIYMARALTPDRRANALDSVRGIFRGQPGSDKNDPFSGREPGDSDFGSLGDDTMSRLKAKRKLGTPSAKTAKTERKAG